MHYIWGLICLACMAFLGWSLVCFRRELKATRRNPSVTRDDLAGISLASPPPDAMENGIAGSRETFSEDYDSAPVATASGHRFVH